MVLESWVVTVTFRFDSRLVDLSNRLVLQRFTFYNGRRKCQQKISAPTPRSKYEPRLRCKM